MVCVPRKYFELVGSGHISEMPGSICCRASESLSIQGAIDSVKLSSSSQSRNISAWKHTKRGKGRLYPRLALVLAVHNSDGAHKPSSSTLKIPEGDMPDDDKPDAKRRGKESIMVRLRRYGVAGMLSYGLLNTIYYLGMFLFAWFYISPAPSGLGYRAAAERFIKLFALVWAGSQVTKLLRAGCALALAPVIDKGLTWLTDNSRFRSRAEVFRVIVTSCFGLALTVFLVITFLWA